MTLPITRFFNQTLTSARPARASDGEGGWTVSLVPRITTPLACSARPLSYKELAQANQIDAQITHRVYVVAGADVQRDDVLTLSGGLVAEVDIVRNPGQVGRHLEIDVISRQRGR